METRRTFITLHHAYHGDTVGAMSKQETSYSPVPSTRCSSVSRAPTHHFATAVRSD